MKNDKIRKKTIIFVVYLMKMRKLSVTDLNRLSAEDFRSSEKLPLIVVLDNVRSIDPACRFGFLPARGGLRRGRRSGELMPAVRRLLFLPHCEFLHPHNQEDIPGASTERWGDRHFEFLRFLPAP